MKTYEVFGYFTKSEEPKITATFIISEEELLKLYRRFDPNQFHIHEIKFKDYLP